ncbi:MAG: alpha/beta hydrolase [Reichenbachiella sp.]|uniref:alpha/beta hydrolase n=1 Tax=Reichenbachiella sp. TaxID=2184521 RepID=UPI003265A02F
MNNFSQLYKIDSGLQLEFTSHGNGDRCLICFHGFGQDFSVFDPLHDLLPDFRVVSLNLLFHGQSNRTSEEKYLRHEEWQKMFNGFLDHLRIKRFSIVGYSMGARYVSSTIHSFANRIDHCIFIAPDGVVNRRSYVLATFPWGPEQLFRYFMKNPRPFFAFLDLAEKIKLINPWTIKFSRNQLKDPAIRRRVLQSWVTLKKLRLKQKALVELLNGSNYQTTFYFGKYDSIIAYDRHLHFLNQLRNNKVIILDTGHTQLLHESFTTIRDQLSEY